ncbi:MAG: hypothetical protein IH978_04675 [Nitrospinae bacterium]|nr:hypothetical protein [Nitrospinota bacterium]
MAVTKDPAQSATATFDQDIQQFRQQLASLKAFLMNSSTTSIEEFDLAAEELIAGVFGRSSTNLET